MKRLVLLALCLLGISLHASAQYAAAPPAVGSVSYQGLWWNSPGGSQSGWGLNIAHQGNILFATWFTYDANGKGTWLVMPDTEFVPNTDNSDMYDGMSMGMDGMMDGMYGMPMAPDTSTSFAGTIYRTSGPAFSAPFDASKVKVTAVGYAVFNFVTPSDGTFTFSMSDGTTASYPITRQVFSTMPTCAIAGSIPPATGNFSDLWWNPSESGWGVNLAQEGDIVFATWFTYDASGNPVWYVMSDGERTAPAAKSWSGAFYTTTGPSFASRWDNAKVTVTNAGTASFAFTDASNGTFTATIGGQTITKSITRQVYSTPLTACQ